MGEWAWMLSGVAIIWGPAILISGRDVTSNENLTSVSWYGWKTRLNPPIWTVTGAMAGQEYPGNNHDQY